MRYSSDEHGISSKYKFLIAETVCHMLKSAWEQDIIRIHKHYVLAFGHIEAGVSGRTHSPVRFVYGAETGVGCRIPVADHRRRIRTSIVHEDHLKRSELLGKDAVKASREIFFCIIYRNDDADPVLVHISSF